MHKSSSLLPLKGNYRGTQLSALADGIEPPPEPTYDEGRIIVITNKKEQKDGKG